MNIELITCEELKLRPDRQRVTIPEEHILALTESISQHGLFHAPVVTKGLELVAGDCRRRAMENLAARGERIRYNGEELPLGYIPVVLTDKTDEIALYRIELEENLRRKNLTQLEEAQAIAKLHELGKSNDPGWTNKQTAEQLATLRQQETLGANEAEVAAAIILSQFADDPEVKAAKTKTSALRIAKRKMEIDFRTALGMSHTTPSTTGNEVLVGDSLQILKTLPARTFDGIITDPPYGIDADDFGEASFLGLAHSYADSEEYAEECIAALAFEGYRICGDEAHLYCFLDIGYFPIFKRIFQEAHWEVWSTPLIWAKGAVGHSPRPEHGPKRSYEAILFASKGDKRVLQVGSDILQFNSVYSGDKLHAAEKPVDLLAHLLGWSFIAGSKILDPFCGSGSIFPAAHKLGITATGIELDSSTAAIARDRITRL